jgi:hypothetical protein
MRRWKKLPSLPAPEQIIAGVCSCSRAIFAALSNVLLATFECYEWPLRESKTRAAPISTSLLIDALPAPCWLRLTPTSDCHA